MVRIHPSLQDRSEIGVGTRRDVVQSVSLSKGLPR